MRGGEMDYARLLVMVAATLDFKVGHGAMPVLHGLFVQRMRRGDGG